MRNRIYLEHSSRFTKFFVGLFLDHGKPSLSRVLSTVVVFASIIWTTFILLKEHKLPDMGGLSLYVSGTVVSLYGANKVADAIQQRTPEPPVQAGDALK